MSSYPRLMTVSGLSIGVNRPAKRPHQGRGLAPYAPQIVYDVADFKESPKGWPRALTPTETSFFVPVTADHEMWFDFNALNEHTHFVAVVVTVQRVNAVTGQKADHVYLEKYIGTCPKHEVAFEADRFCPECKFKWPAQNYITNAAPGTGGKFWLDGWRSQDGEIRQFVFADVEQGLGVAQQLIGEERTADIRFAVFLSKKPKPVPPQSLARRGGSSWGSSGLLSFSAKSSNLIGSAHPNDGLLGACLESMGPSDSDVDMMSFNSTTRGAPEVLSRIGTPTKQEVSFGRAVDQEIYPDPNDIDFWQAEPAAVIMLTPAPADWVQTVVRNGPTVDRTLGGMGPLAGLKGVG